MQRFGSFFFVGLFIIFMFIARMKEHLNCEVRDATSITCTRTQDRIFFITKKTHDILDLNTIELHKRKIGNKHNITAMNSKGKAVVLLSVPEKGTAYAQEIIQKLKTLPANSNEKSVEYTRNEMHSQLLLLAVVGTVILFCIIMLFRKKKKPSHS